MADSSVSPSPAVRPPHRIHMHAADNVAIVANVGGLKAGETKTVRGKLYVLPNDPKGLLKRYERDFGK